MAEMKRYSGWRVFHPWYQRETPKALDEFIMEISMVEANFDLPDLFPTKEEAVKLLKHYLAEQRDQALKDLDFLSKPYVSPNGILHICPESKMEEWRAECRRRLEIAERGLELCQSANTGNLSE